MRRILLNYLLPIILPFVIYGLWLAFARYKARKAGEEGGPEWRDAPWTWLMIASAGLVAAGFVVLALQGGTSPDTTYYPPQYIDGEIVQSHAE
jgi:peptidoglycan/LPS O-acetylase OafA/YrhL